MSHYCVVGGNKLSGEIFVNGSKNAVLPILAGTILNAGETVLLNVPQISDVSKTVDILKTIGCDVSNDNNTYTINSKNASNFEIYDDVAKDIRSSITMLGAILQRFKKAKIIYPGGCEIGLRPIDLHLKAFKKMGVLVVEKNGFIECEVNKIVGAKINLDFPSVGATENIMLLATKAVGITCIYNAAREPEIVDLQNFLNSMGAKIRGAGSETIYIEGVSNLHDTKYSVMPDRIEAGTFLIATAIAKGEVLLKNCNPNDLRQLILRLTEMGSTIEEYKNDIYIKCNERLKCVELIKTLPYPGFPTDLQPQMMALLTVSKGTSVIIETIFESRFKHIAELIKMNADISYYNRTAVIKGVSNLEGALVSSSDLRAGVALILAGLAAKGETTVLNAKYIKRGYENIEKALSSIGANIRYIDD